MTAARSCRWTRDRRRVLPEVVEPRRPAGLATWLGGCVLPPSAPWSRVSAKGGDNCGVFIAVHRLQRIRPDFFVSSVRIGVRCAASLDRGEGFRIIQRYPDPPFPCFPFLSLFFLSCFPLLLLPSSASLLVYHSASS